MNSSSSNQTPKSLSHKVGRHSCKKPTRKSVFYHARVANDKWSIERRAREELLKIPGARTKIQEEKGLKQIAHDVKSRTTADEFKLKVAKIRRRVNAEKAAVAAQNAVSSSKQAASERYIHEFFMTPELKDAFNDIANYANGGSLPNIPFGGFSRDDIETLNEIEGGSLRRIQENL
jgi:hypothetical protein